MEKTETELGATIAEYLTSRGYLQTVATFQTETQRRPRQATPTQTASLQREFLVAFECGERAAFFNLWNRHVPQAMLERDPTCQNLEFTLSVYFAIYPIRTGSGDRVQSFQEFTVYLETRGAVLAQSQELAAYCALPYVPDPSKHPSFKKLFTESWVSEMKSRLVHFLRLSLPGTPAQPKLLSIFLSNKASLSSEANSQEVLELREQLSECQRQYGQRLNEIQASYHTLVGIAMELLDALESAIAGRMITPENIQGICSRLFGSSLPPAVATSNTLRPTTATSILRQSVMSLRESVQAPITFPTSTPLPDTRSPPSHTHTLSNSPLTKSSSSPKHFPAGGKLDFGLIKSELLSANDKKKALLLQALRWRLTRSLTSDQRSSVMSDYITNDLLGCTVRDSYHTQLTALLKSQSILVREQICRLLNAFSSLASGRTYLTGSTSLVSALCSQLVATEEGEPGEGEGDGGVEGNVTRNALGAVQKLSLRRPLQGLMIGCGLPQWVIGVISREGSSDYTLRYCLALLMNLCLRGAGRQACRGAGHVVLRTLGELLEHEDQEICSYVNGILYSLLTLPQLKMEAKSMGMADMLSSALEASPPELQSQLRYIITQLNSDTPPSAVANDDEAPPSDDSAEEEDEEEEEEEPDVLEGDEDEVAIVTTGPVGESLLVGYLITSELFQTTSSRKLLDAPFLRPVTPQGRSVSRAQSVAEHRERDHVTSGDGSHGDGVRRTSTAAR